MSATDTEDIRMLSTKCQQCGFEYAFPADTFGLVRITCPDCKARLYMRTGNVVKHINEFHTARTESENPGEWQLGDFAEIILSSGRARNFDIETFMQALIKLPEWPDIDFMDSKHRKEDSLSIEECLASTPAIERPYQLSLIFNRLISVFKRADNFGCSQLSSYILFLREGAVHKSKKETLPRPVIDENFVYEGMVNENGEAVGMDIPISIPGKKFIITGKLDMKKATYEELIVNAGGLISTTVSRADYLVIGENHKEKISRKAKDAQRYDVPAVTLNSLKRALLLSKSTEASEGSKAQANQTCEKTRKRN